jgi:hypothetical protein
MTNFWTREVLFGNAGVQMAFLGECREFKAIVRLPSGRQCLIEEHIADADRDRLLASSGEKETTIRVLAQVAWQKALALS